MHCVYKDDHGQMNVTNFEKWVAKKLIPYHLSVIVVDDAPTAVATSRISPKYHIYIYMAVQVGCVV